MFYGFIPNLIKKSVPALPTHHLCPLLEGWGRGVLLSLPPRVQYRGLSWIKGRYQGTYTLIILLQYLIRNLRNMMKLTGIIALLGFLGAHLSVSTVSRHLHYLTLSFLYQRISSMWCFKSSLKVSGSQFMYSKSSLNTIYGCPLPLPQSL